MLTPKYLDGLPNEIIKYFQDTEDFMISDIARRISKAGTATSTAELQRIALQWMGEDLTNINKKIAETLRLTEQEVKRIFLESADIAADNQIDIMKKLGISQDTAFLKNTCDAAIKAAMGDFSNLTRTAGFVAQNGQFTLWTNSLREALSLAQIKVATGAADYNSAIRQTLRQFSKSGLSVLYASGARRSMESVIRQCVIGGVKDMARAVLEKNAKDIGADGWEISAHIDCAPDHEFCQGRQYSNQDYEALNGSLARPIGALNCRHTAYPIVMGLSQRAYGDEELAEMRKKNAEGITYEGKHYTLYEADQMMRKAERAIRKTKRELIAADAAGLKDDFTALSIKLRSQREYYNDFSKKSGLMTQQERTQVGGYGRSMSGKSLKAESRAMHKYQEDFFDENIPNNRAKFKDLVYNKSEKLLDKIYRLEPEQITGLAGTLSNKEVRSWYKKQNETIPDKIDKTKTIEEQARQAHELRNVNRTAARDAMSNQAQRKALDMSDPNLSFEETLSEKMNRKNMTREQAIADILETSIKTNKSVDDRFGV